MLEREIGGGNDRRGSDIVALSMARVIGLAGLVENVGRDGEVEPAVRRQPLRPDDDMAARARFPGPQRIRRHGREPYLLSAGRVAQHDSFRKAARRRPVAAVGRGPRSEEHTSELQSLMLISYAGFCLKKKTTTKYKHTIRTY